MQIRAIAELRSTRASGLAGQSTAKHGAIAGVQAITRDSCDAERLLRPTSATQLLRLPIAEIATGVSARPHQAVALPHGIRHRESDGREPPIPRRERGACQRF